MCLLVTLDTCIKQYNYNHAWYTFENCEQEILRMVRITLYGKWEARFHMTSLSILNSPSLNKNDKDTNNNSVPKPSTVMCKGSEIVTL